MYQTNDRLIGYKGTLFFWDVQENGNFFAIFSLEDAALLFSGRFATVKGLGERIARQVRRTLDQWQER